MPIPCTSPNYISTKFYIYVGVLRLDSRIQPEEGEEEEEEEEEEEN